MRPYSDAAHHLHFFHLTFDGPVLEEWRHAEEHSGDGPPIPFRFFWLPIRRAHVLREVRALCSVGCRPAPA